MGEDREAQKNRRALLNASAIDFRRELVADAMLASEYLLTQPWRQEALSQRAALAFFGARKNCSLIHHRSVSHVKKKST
jgi:hypothetical protein